MSPTVFLSYRREETQGTAGRLADRLIDRLGEDGVFIDVDRIEPGSDFVDAVERAVVACDVLVALIGPRWSQITDRRGRRRLDDPDDPVALEIRLALERRIRVIPVLVDGASMPDRDDLPPSLSGLQRRNAVRLDHATFRTDVVRLIDAVTSTPPVTRPSTMSPTEMPPAVPPTQERRSIAQRIRDAVIGEDEALAAWATGPARHDQPIVTPVVDRRPSRSAPASVGRPIDVTDATFADLLQDEKPVLVEFWAQWCGPCKMIAPVLVEIAAEHAAELVVAKLDIDLNPGATRDYQVTSIPTMIVFQNGEPIKQIVGAKPKPALLRDLAEFIG